MMMIAIIHLPEKETTLNNIARKLGTSKQNVKQLVCNAEKKGYVATLPSEFDRRSCNVKITESGKHAMAEGNERGLCFFADAFHDFTVEELETFWALLKKLYRFDGEEQDGFEQEVDYKIG